MLCNVETRAAENVPGNAHVGHHSSIQERVKMYFGGMVLLKLSVCFACMQKLWVL